MKTPDGQDPTIRIAASAKASAGSLYNAAAQAKKRGMEGGLIDNDAAWLAMLHDLGITEFATGRDIGRLNAHITTLLKDIAS